MRKLKLLTILSAFMLLASCGSGGTTNNSNNGGNIIPFNPFIPDGTISQIVNPGTTSTNPFNPIIPGTTSQSTPSTSSSVAGNTYESSMSGYNAEIEFSYGNSVTYRVNNNGMSSVLTGTYSQSGNSVNMTFTYGTVTYNGETQSTSVNQSMDATVNGNSLTLSFQGTTEVYSLKNGGGYTPTPSYPSVNPGTSTSLSGKSYSTNSYGYYASISFSGSNVTYAVTGDNMDTRMYGTYSVSGINVSMTFNSGYYTYRGETHSLSGLNQTLNATLSGSSLTLQIEEGAYVTLYEGGSYTPDPTPAPTPGTNTMANRSFSYSADGNTMTLSFTSSEVTMSASAAGQSASYNGTYSQSGNTIYMTFTFQGQTQSMTGTLSGSQLSVSTGYATMIFNEI